jgi:hypothetical protein
MKAANKATVRGLTTRAKNTLRDQLVRFFESKADLSGNEAIALSLMQADEQLTLEFGSNTLRLAGVDQQGKRTTVTLHMT